MCGDEHGGILNVDKIRFFSGKNIINFCCHVLVQERVADKEDLIWDVFKQGKRMAAYGHEMSLFGSDDKYFFLWGEISGEMEAADFRSGSFLPDECPYDGYFHGIMVLRAV